MTDGRENSTLNNWFITGWHVLEVRRHGTNKKHLASFVAESRKISHNSETQRHASNRNMLETIICMPNGKVPLEYYFSQT